MTHSIPKNWARLPIKEINFYRSITIEPIRYSQEIFELYSVPSFANGSPEIVFGGDIGSTKLLVEPNDILICKINPRINRVWIVAPKSNYRQIASSEWIVIRAPDIDALYLKNYFSSPYFRELMNEVITGIGGSLTRVQPKRVAQFPVLVPPRQEQTRIASKVDQLLSQIERSRIELTQILDRIKLIKTAVLTSAISGNLTKDWRSINDNQQWEQYTLSDTCYSITDGDHQAPPQIEKGIPFITISAINDGHLNLSKATRFVSPTYYENIKPARKPEMGDILFSVTGSLAISALVDVKNAFVFQRHIAILKPNNNKIRSKFLLYILNTAKIKHQADKLATGTAQLTLSLFNLRSIKIPVPVIEEQDEIVGLIEKLFERMDYATSYIESAHEKIDKFPPNLLTKAVSGNLNAHNPQDEPVEMLIERMRIRRELQNSNSTIPLDTKEPKMDKLTKEVLQKIIEDLPKDVFSFEELHKLFPKHYDTIKNLIYELLSSSTPAITQFFDKDNQTISFKRRSK